MVLQNEGRAVMLSIFVRQLNSENSHPFFKVDILYYMEKFESKDPPNIDYLQKKRVSLMSERFNLMQEQLDLPDTIRPILFKMKEHPPGTAEGDRLRAELEALETRSRKIHLPIQEKWKEIQECEKMLGETNRFLGKTKQPAETETKEPLRKAA